MEGGDSLAQTQQYLAEHARYIVGVGLMLADDFLTHLGREKLAKINTKAAYIVRIMKPMPAWFFLYGIGVCLIPEGGCSKLRYPTKTFAEHWALSNMITELDPENKYKLRTEYMLIDLAVTQGRIVQIPTDEEVVILHLAVQDMNIVKPLTTRKSLYQIHEAAKKKPVANETKMRRGLRMLDRRRYSEAGLVPPPSRFADLKKIKIAVEKKSHLDPSIDESGDEMAREREDDNSIVRWRGEKDLLSKILSEMKAPPVKVKLEPPPNTLPPTAEDDEDEDLFGEAAGSEDEMSEDTGDPYYCPSPKKASRKKPKPMSLQAVMRSMRGRSRKLHRRQLDTDLPSLGSGGGGGGDDMED